MIDDATRAEWRRLAEAIDSVVETFTDNPRIPLSDELDAPIHELWKCRAIVPALLDEVERLTRERDEARAALTRGVHGDLQRATAEVAELRRVLAMVPDEHEPPCQDRRLDMVSVGMQPDCVCVQAEIRRVLGRDGKEG